MQWLICYDSADDTRRQRLVKVLLDYGQRVQESVFWIDADDELAGRILERLRRVTLEEEDSVWVVPLCAACARKIEALGRTRVPELPEYYIV
jgi:CRISPR-associated protein Cas2